MRNRRPASRPMRNRPLTRSQGIQTGRNQAAETKPAEAKPAVPRCQVIEIKSIPDADNTCIQCHTSPDTWDPKDQAQYKFHIPLEAFEERRALAKGGAMPGLSRRRSDRSGDQGPPGQGRLPCGQVAGRHSRLLRPLPLQHRVHAAFQSVAAHRSACRVLDQRSRQAIEDKRRSASGDLYFLPRSAARQCRRSEAARHSSGERTRLARLPHEGGPDLCEVPFRPEAHGGAIRITGSRFPATNMPSGSKSVHGKALLEKGDLSAPTCNNCHGNHGAAPPQIGLGGQRLRRLPRQDRQTLRGHQDAAQVRNRGPPRLRHLPQQS